MKHLFTVLLLFFAVSTSALAQTISFPTGNVKEFYMETTGKAFTQINFNNETDQVLNLDWQTILINAPEGWAYQTCDNGLCHPMTPPVNETNSMKPIFPKSQSGMGFMNMEMLKRDCAGKATANFEFRVFDHDTKADVAVIKFNFHCYPASRPEGGQSITVSIYPNPVQDLFTVANTHNTALKTATITDLTGKTVAVYPLSGNATESLNVGSLNAGIYLVKVEDVNGLSHVQRLIKQ